ncbi:Asp/Glu racemase [Stappia sp. ES.058]|uniref:maleate cis-trans isomerase family protein n=1 Tax=Stappia sp. ES.058 TaxID=1881061 RepID=UPI00087CDF84|nr:Asp/Glu racemase [Stappia sp. ES.058]SDU18018.1 maleate isomerase [Stappia sp. ES.058]
MTVFSFDLDTPDPVRLGLIILQADETIERDFRRLLPMETAVHVSRVPSGLEVTQETLLAMQAHLPAAAGLFPDALRFDAVGYACTSGASVIGSARVAELVRAGANVEAITDPVQALIAACRAGGITRLALLSPYVEDVSDMLRQRLAGGGVDTPVFGSFNVAEESKVARIAPASVIDAATRLGADPSVEAVFLSCTNLRTLDLLEEVEVRIGKPVFSSNQVLAWHLCKLAGAPMAPGFGQLMAQA